MKRFKIWNEDNNYEYNEKNILNAIRIFVKE